MNVIETKYQHIIKVEGKISRGKHHDAIVTACLFFTYQEFGEYCTSDYIRKIFNLKQNVMSQGISKYMKAFPKCRSDCITPEKLLPWMMKLVGLGSSHYQHIKLNQFLANSSSF